MTKLQSALTLLNIILLVVLGSVVVTFHSALLVALDIIEMGATSTFSAPQI